MPMPFSHSTPRELLLEGHPYALSDEGLLSVMVGDVCAREMSGLLGQDLSRGLWCMSAEDLVALDGVGPATAARLLACVEMSRRATVSRADTRPTISTPEDVVSVLGAWLRGADREHFVTLALNTKNRLLKVIEVSIGSLNASIVHPRELFKGAVRLSAASVVIAHNHPSGDPTPSAADIQLTRRIVRAGDVLGIEVLDHVVIGESGDHASLRDLGLM